MKDYKGELTYSKPSSQRKRIFIGEKGHRLPLHKIIVALDLKLARILLERLRKTSWNLHMFLDILELRAKNKNDNLGKTDYIIWSQVLEKKL